MSATPLRTADRDTSNVLHYGPWLGLTETIRAFQPDIVVLIARKMPHIARLLNLDFGDGVLIVSDLAIPFIHRRFNKARIAIVDDVINVGSTIQNTIKYSEACGAKTVRAFALARRADSEILTDVYCQFSTPIDRATVDDFAWRIPDALSVTIRPYDLVFPLIHCEFVAPFQTYATLRECLKQKFGSDVWELSTSRSLHQGIAKFSVRFNAPESSSNKKIRLYVDFGSRRCTVVPMHIPNEIDLSNLGNQRDGVVAAFYEGSNTELAHVPANASLWRDEPKHQLAIFSLGLDLAIDKIGEFREFFSPSSKNFFDTEAASLVFGPAIKKYHITFPARAEETIFNQDPIPDRASNSPSPFLAKWAEHYGSMDGLIEAIRLQKGPEYIDGAPGKLVFAIFSLLAKNIGADKVSEYELDWPYSSNDIMEHPYLRLRIGLTYSDLMILCTTLGTSSTLLRPSNVSFYLDSLIDEGAVVPTLANYEGTIYRVYRKGESNLRDTTNNVVRYSSDCAADEIGKPLSRTRVAKLLAILSLSQVGEDIVDTCTIARGNVGVYPTNEPDQIAEITRFMRNYGLE